VKLAVGKCLGAVMDSGRWTEIGLLTGASGRIEGHGRLLRALYFGDDDYQGAVYDVLPAILGETRRDFDKHPPRDVTVTFPNLRTVSDYLDVPKWLAVNEPELFAQVIQPAEADATLPDGTVLDAAEAAATRLEVAEMRRQVERIRRDYADDPEALVGQAKEVIETACKTILGLSGAGSETKYDVPELVNKTLIHLGLHPKDVAEQGNDPTEARALKRVFGGLSSVLMGAAELRNARGTGHGRSGAPLIDERMARMTAGLVLPAVVYLCEVYEGHTEQGAEVPANHGDRIRDEDVEAGSVVQHETFGRGTVVQKKSIGDQCVISINFDRAGTKRLLLRYAPLRLVRR
jgi:hypothetical protein